MRWSRERAGAWACVFDVTMSRTSLPSSDLWSSGNVLADLQGFLRSLVRTTHLAKGRIRGDLPRISAGDATRATWARRRAPRAPARARTGLRRAPCRARPRSLRPRASSSASRPEATPPMPTIGSSTAFAQAWTQASAIGRSAGPDAPPGPRPSRGRSVCGSNASPRRVFTSESPSAPRRATARARLRDVRATPARASRTAAWPSHARAAAVSSAAVSGASSTFGHERLSSIDLRRRRGRRAARTRGRSRRRRTRRRRPRARRRARAAAGSSRPPSASIPGFWRPIEFSIQPPVSAIRGGGLPSRGSGVTVFVTKASRLRATSGAVSASRQPLALRSGTLAPCGQIVAHCCRLTVRSGHVQGLTLFRTCKSRLEHRAMYAKSDVVSCDSHNTAVASSVSARHRRLPRELRARDALADRLEHRLRPAGEDVSRVGRAGAR